MKRGVRAGVGNSVMPAASQAPSVLLQCYTTSGGLVITKWFLELQLLDLNLGKKKEAKKKREQAPLPHVLPVSAAPDDRVTTVQRKRIRSR